MILYGLSYLLPNRINLFFGNPGEGPRNVVVFAFFLNSYENPTAIGVGHSRYGFCIVARFQRCGFVVHIPAFMHVLKFEKV